MNHVTPILIWTTWLSALALIFVTLLPLLPVGRWYVRVWDFPRVQLCVLMIVVLLMVLACLWLKGWRPDLLILGGCMLLGFAWQCSHVLPFTPLWPKELAWVSDANQSGEASSDVTRFGVMNLKFDNTEADKAVPAILDQPLDLLLLVEYDEAWAARLADLAKRYPHQAGVAKGQGMGMMLFSRWPIDESSVRYLVSERRPSVWATVTVAQGKRVRFVGIHPTPPGLADDTKGARRDSRVRDAELMLVAQEVADTPQADWLIAGDLNDVAWSHTTRLFKCVSGLKDLRVGRKLLNSYSAQSWLFRYPLDHVFLSPNFNVAKLHRQYIPGSDHFAILTDVLLTNDNNQRPSTQNTETDTNNPATPDDQKEARELIREGKQDAKDQGVAAE